MKGVPFAAPIELANEVAEAIDAGTDIQATEEGLGVHQHQNGSVVIYAEKGAAVVAPDGKTIAVVGEMTVHYPGQPTEEELPLRHRRRGYNGAEKGTVRQEQNKALLRQCLLGIQSEVDALHTQSRFAPSLRPNLARADNDVRRALQLVDQC